MHIISAVLETTLGVSSTHFTCSRLKHTINSTSPGCHFPPVKSSGKLVWMRETRVISILWTSLTGVLFVIPVNIVSIGHSKKSICRLICKSLSYLHSTEFQIDSLVFFVVVRIDGCENVSPLSDKINVHMRRLSREGFDCDGVRKCIQFDCHISVSCSGINKELYRKSSCHTEAICLIGIEIAGRCCPVVALVVRGNNMEQLVSILTLNVEIIGERNLGSVDIGT